MNCEVPDEFTLVNWSSGEARLEWSGFQSTPMRQCNCCFGNVSANCVNIMWTGDVWIPAYKSDFRFKSDFSFNPFVCLLIFFFITDCPTLRDGSGVYPSHHRVTVGDTLAELPDLHRATTETQTNTPTFTPLDLRVATSPNLHVSGLWEEAGVPDENQGPGWESNPGLLAALSCPPLLSTPYKGAIKQLHVGVTLISHEQRVTPRC